LRRTVSALAGVELNLRQTYARMGPKTLVKVGPYAHARQMKRAGRCVKKLKTFLGRVTRDIERNIEGTIYADKGYRAHDYTGPATVHLAGSKRKKRSWSLRRWLRRRNAIEPLIGHLKSESRLDRNLTSSAQTATPPTRSWPVADETSGSSCEPFVFSLSTSDFATCFG